ncbi:glycosyltransferase, partial [Candidatus Omnitrophota bacterium]
IFEKIAKKYKKNTSISLKFDAALAQKIYASSDIFLMPSRYEPCGLGQLISFKYGTVPVGRRTGGLADTIVDYNPETEEGNGFLFDKTDSKEFLGSIKRALDVYER